MAYTGPFTWNVEWIFSVVNGIDMEMSSGCSRSYVTYTGTLRWSIERMLMVVRGVIRAVEMER